MTQREQVVALLPNLSKLLMEKYDKFNADMGYTNRVVTRSFSFDLGPNYARVVCEDGQRSTYGFVALKDVTTKSGSCKAGDLLKAAGWKAPTLNFTRGSIFDLAAADAKGFIRWTGIG